ncbi:hypothetical protein [Bradyrhizobium sp. USDA 3315]
MRTPFKFKGPVNVWGSTLIPDTKAADIRSVQHEADNSATDRGERLFKIWFASIDQKSGKKYVFDKSPVQDIDKELVRGMTRELLSLQQLNGKIREADEEVGKKLTAVETDVRTRFAEQRSTVDGLWLVWRSITLGVIGALLVALFITDVVSNCVATSKRAPWALASAENAAQGNMIVTSKEGSPLFDGGRSSRQD